MTTHLPLLNTQLLINPAFNPTEAYGPTRSDILNKNALAEAANDLQSWPGFHQTPLHTLPALAKALGIASVAYKDEGTRFGLGSFKSLGGAYAVSRLLRKALSKQLHRPVSMQDLFKDDIKKLSHNISVTCATDGNHGRSVAWGAQMFGCQCVIYIHATVSEGRKKAIEHYGAQVVRTKGNYDEAVRQADIDAQTHHRFVISDTSYPGYMDVPRDVMQGYQVMVKEAASQLSEKPTHIFVQAGVGGLAAAVCAYFWETDGAQRPQFIVVEPTAADCLYQSAKAGKPTIVSGELDTLMAGLACGEVSLLAWEILAQGANAFCKMSDQAAIDTMRLMAHPLEGDTPIVAGESAVAGVAAAIAIAQNPDLRKQLHMNADSRFLFFGSEAATDPELYEKLVGQRAETIAHKE